MRIVFMGTPAFAVPSLQALIDSSHEVIGVVTQPDRPKGRKKQLTPPPVKELAGQHGIPVYQPESLKAEGALELIREWRPELIVTAAYGQLLPVELLELPPHRCINIHASLLPKYRGGAPIQHAIINGERTTGVTIMYMEKGLDTGDMLARVQVPIEDADDNGTMHEKLSIAGAQLLTNTLPELLSGRLTPVPQNHQDATIARNISRSDEQINWQRTSIECRNLIRGLHPWPIAYTTAGQEIFKVWQAEIWSELTEEERLASPGTLLRVMPNGLLVKTGDGGLLLTVVQPAGKKAMPVSEYVRGKHLPVGTVFQII